MTNPQQKAHNAPAAIIQVSGRSIFLHIQLPSGPAQKQKTPGQQRLFTAGRQREMTHSHGAPSRGRGTRPPRKTGMWDWNKLHIDKALRLTSVPTEAMVPGR